MLDTEKRSGSLRVMEALGYTFHDEALLRRALTHPSAGKNDNQRLEFLGDAVLQYLMSDRLYRGHPEDREGSLTHMRARLVCEAALSRIAQGLGIGEALVMDRGEELTGGRTKPSVLCDAMEAVLAAVYLDGGMEAARDVVERCWPADGEVDLPMQDSKSRLQAILCSRRRCMTGTRRSAGAAGGPRNRPNRPRRSRRSGSCSGTPGRLSPNKTFP